MTTVKKWMSWVAAATLLPASVALAENPNQIQANQVASRLGQVEALRGADLTVRVKDGVATLSGTALTVEQLRAAVDAARTVPGLSQVRSEIRVVSNRDEAFRPTQMMDGGMVMESGMMGDPVSGGMVGAPISGGMVGAPISGGMVGAPISGGMVSGVAAADGGPTPLGPAVLNGNAGAFSSANYPNYAWPRYAPYPNFSAVGYPTVYPWQAWPNIGPFYPYPEVPLDWRAVTLRWDDGVWWLDFKKHYTRPFLTPYPFGLWAY